MFSKQTKESMIGNIYVGRVQECVKGINAAFVTIKPGQNVFLQVKETESIHLLNREYDGRLKQGDELLVQIDRLGHGNKLPSASSDINLIGQYVICHVFKKGISYSKKLSAEETAMLKEAWKQCPMEGKRNYGFTVRTNAETLSDISLMFSEIEEFLTIAEKMKNTSSFRSVYSCVYHAKPEYLVYLVGIPQNCYEEIMTDDEEIYQQLLECFPENRVHFYHDKDYPLSKLYSLKTHLTQALGTQVWLPKGGYLVIEPTEAMTVIDVNSGKGSNQKGKGREQVAFLTNLEAAREIARQLRLRNCTGMILVDFINMEEELHKKELLEKLQDYLDSDRQQCRVVDMTPLGIVEITRKKFNQPLKEMLDIRMI